MKKITYIIIYLLSITFVIAQDYTVMHNKYWYYRTRLRNDFMKVGLGQGCSIPMEQRGLGYEPYSTTPNYDFTNNPGADAQWGDAMGELGYYIGILATEYHLLSRNNQETDSVRYELYCALEALNRMDYWAETAYTHAIANSQNPQTFGAQHNGFMVRDDVPIDFIQNNMRSFNYFGNRGFCSKIKLNSIASSSGNGAITQGETYIQPQGLGTNGHWEKNYAGSYISQDNWINCIVGLALVRKFVDGVNYTNRSFSDGQGPDFGQEAFSISLRVMDYFKADPYWLLRYPTNNLIGSDWGGIGTGLAYAHAEAVNKINQKKWGNYSFPDAVSFNNWCEYNDWRNDGNWLTVLFKNTVLIPIMFTGYSFSPHISGNLHSPYSMIPGFIQIQSPLPPGNPFGTSLFIPGGERAYKDFQLNAHTSNNDVAVQVCNISAVCNCDYTFRGTDTKHDIQHHINDHQIWHPELLRAVLHGEGVCPNLWSNNSYFGAAVSLMSNAPCEGPYNWVSFNNLTFTQYGPDSPTHWHTQSQLDHPEGRDGNSMIGEFNGIDYMFYHNLITIVDGEKHGWNDSKQIVDYGRRHITTSYPTSVGGQMWGSSSKPATVKSFEYIVANGINNVNTDITFLAGKEITLGNGFSSVNGSVFTAGIQQFDCSEILTNPLDPSTNARTVGSGGNNNQKIYPDLLPTSYGEKYVSEDQIETKSNHQPSLVHVDSLFINSLHTITTSVVVELAPNPCNGISKLIISRPEMIKTIDIIDPTGRLLFTLNSIFYSNDIDLNNFSKGIFTILIKGSDNDVIVKKLAIQ